MLRVDNFSFVERLSQPFREKLETIIDWFPVSAGSIVIQQGTPSDFAVFVLEGAFDCFSQTGGTNRLMSTVQAGSVLGEVGLILDSPRTATCQASKDGIIGILSKTDLHKMAEEEPELYLALLQILAVAAANRLLEVSKKVNHLIQKNEIAVQAAMQILDSSLVT